MSHPNTFTCDACPMARLTEAEFGHLRQESQELRQRVDRVENTVNRGVLLLVANLAGVVVILTEQLLAR